MPFTKSCQAKGRLSFLDSLRNFFLLFFLSFLFSFPFVVAEPVVEFDYLVQNDDTASLINMRTYYGTPESVPVFSEYLLTIEDAQQRILQKVYFPAYFIVFDPFAEVSTIPVTLTLPYQQHYAMVSMYHKEKIISRQDLRLLCQEDGLCQTGENSVSCPRDCPQSGKDNLCERREDKICDPDCLILENECRQEKSALALGVSLAALAGLLATLLLFMVAALRHARGMPEQQFLLKKKMQHLLLAAAVFAVLVLISAVWYFGT